MVSRIDRRLNMAGTDGGFLALLLAMGVLLYVSWMRTEWSQ
jgi:hypothetical protein